MIAFLIAICLAAFATALASYAAWRSTPLTALLNIYLPLLSFLPVYRITTHGVLLAPAVSASLPVVLALVTLTGVQPMDLRKGATPPTVTERIARSVPMVSFRQVFA
jgi:hypothetical protein